MHALIKDHYEPGRSVIDAYGDYVDKVAPDMSNKRFFKLSYQSLWSLQDDGLADDEGLFASLEDVFEHWGVDPMSGQLHSGKRADLHNQKVVAKILGRSGPSAIGGVTYANYALIGGGRVEVIYDGESKNIVRVRDPFDKMIFEKTVERELTMAEKNILMTAALPLAPWIVGGTLGPPIVVSLLTGGSVGGEISTHGVGIDFGFPGTKLGPFSIGPSVGVRYGFEDPYIFDKPLLPGMNWHFNLGAKGPYGLMAGLFINKNSTYDYTLAGGRSRFFRNYQCGA